MSPDTRHDDFDDQLHDDAPAGVSRAAAIALTLVGIVLGIGLTLIIIVADPFGLGWLDAPTGAEVGAEVGAGELYTCGMHPNVLQEEPGTCPICQMNLTPMGAGIGEGSHAGHDHGAEAAAMLYTCPMHPEVLDEEPGSCPICGMDLVPIEVDGGAAPRAFACPLHPDFGGDAPGECPVCGSAYVAGGGREPAAPAHGPTTTAYTCPMHPEIVSDAPGSCAVCGMDLVETEVPLEGPAHASAASAGAGDGRRILYYRHPHDPTITSLEPARDEMGMDFVPVRESAAGEQGATITIDPRVAQNMNVLTAVATRGDLTRSVRTVGYLQYDQERMVSITTKYSGFVERVHANYVGQAVRRGDPLFDVYSPELVQTQEELLSALRFAERMQAAPAEARRRAEALVEAARGRLRFWDLSERQLRAIEEDGRTRRTITVHSPASGLIMRRVPGLAGMQVRPGMDVLHVADLSQLWLSVQLYEDQLAWVAPGSQARIQFTYFPGETFTARVRYAEPQVDETTRTVTVTLEVPNPEATLRVGMYATATFEPVVLADAVLVPTEAVLRTGERDVVVVALGEGRYAPREVVLGPEGDEHLAVVSGLASGERIVVSSQFLIDSESSLREAILKMVARRQGG